MGAGHDRGLKASEYQATASVQHYVMLEQTRAEAVVLSREGDGWTETHVAGLDGVISLGAVGVELPIAEVYRRIHLDA